MKKILYSTTAFILCGIAQSQAACITTPSCTSLGYGSGSSCEGGLKCPFGNYWYCPEDIIKGGECADFPYTCFGLGYNDGEGIGADCNGKYVKCTCSDGFEWKDGQGCVDITDCRIGSILYSDKSCSLSGYEAIAGTKTPIGVVVYSNEKGHGQALALKSIGSYYWSIEYGDISGLTNYNSVSTAATDFASCENSKIIMAAGDKNKYPAVWAAYEYSTEGTKAGDWCLPSAGILMSYSKNQESIIKGIERANGKVIEVGVFWSSTESNNTSAWNVYFGANGGPGTHPKNRTYGVRPVLEF